jgi:predicted acylesterase/phospholipase RssA
MTHYFTFWSMAPPYRNGRLRYHLGQLFMLKQMEHFSATGHSVASVVCDGPSVLYARSRPQSKTQRETIERFLRAVRPPEVDVYRLSELCSEARDSDIDKFKHIERALSEAYANLITTFAEVRVSGQASSDLVTARWNGFEVVPYSLEPIVRRLNSELPRLEPKHILSLLYAIRDRPTWFESQNLSTTGAMLANLCTRAGDASPAIMEAKRNSYVWLALEALRFMDPHDTLHGVDWPHLAATENILNTTGTGPMAISDPATCIFIDATDLELRRKLAEVPQLWVTETNELLHNNPATDISPILESVQSLRGRTRPTGLLSAVGPQVPEGSDSVTLLLRGGGAKGIALIGALEELWPHYNFREYWGTSAGSIIAVLLGAGYSPDEVQEALTETPISSLVEAPKIKRYWNLLRHGAYFVKESIEPWLDNLLRRRIQRYGRIRMRDLPFRTVVFAAQAKQGTVVYDSEGENDDSPVSYAVRSSMAIPLAFRPTSKDGNPVYDGGLLNNFPLRAFLVSKRTSSAFLGITLKSDQTSVRRTNSRWVWSTLRDVVEIWLEQDDYRLAEEYEDRILVLDTSPVKTLDLDLGADETEFLLKTGRYQAAQWLSTRGVTEALEDDQHFRGLAQLRDNILKKRGRA